MSTLSTANIQSKAANTPPVIKDLNGTECGQFCRAWVVSTNTGSILDSFNVSSVTEDGGGNEDYTVNFTTAFSNANYAAVADCNATNDDGGQAFVDNKTASSCIVNVRTTNGSNNAVTGFACVVFGD